MFKLFFIIKTLIYCEAWTHSLLFKSKETFKLAEIQNLEASLQTTYLFDTSQQNNAMRYNLTRLVVDRATGSSLFRLDLQINHNDGELFTNVKSNDDSSVSPRDENLLRSHILSLSSVRRCDWIGQVIAEGSDPNEFLEKLRQEQEAFLAPNRYGLDTDDWNLDYIKLVGEQKSNEKPKYTMKSLLCAVAHELPSKPALNPALAKSRLLLVDASAKDMDSCFLIRSIDHLPKIESKSALQQKWAKRPFQYSSAINFEIAEMVLEILLTLCDNRSDSDGKKSVLLDPTCGSGTFLALALANDFHVEGCDINPSVAEGAIRNIEYLFGKEKVDQYANIEARDSCDLSLTNPSSDASCVVANLPWGRNSILYVDENERILRSVRSQIETGTPCAFITRPSNSGEDQGPSLLFESTGFDVLGQAFVPQRDFLLPVGKKKSKKSNTQDSDSDTRKKNQCVVTIALAS